MTENAEDDYATNEVRRILFRPLFLPPFALAALPRPLVLPALAAPFDAPFPLCWLLPLFPPC